MDNWLAGGPKDDPIIKAKALALVEDCLSSAYNFIDTVEVESGSVELEVSGSLPGVVRPISAYIDCIVEHPKHGRLIVDWKSSSSKPKDNFQLKVYRALMLTRGEAPIKGKFVMLRPGVSDPRPVDLSDVTPESVGAEFAKVEARIDKRIWNAKTGFMCNFCEQRPNCSLMSGSNKWDTSEDEGFPY